MAHPYWPLFDLAVHTPRLSLLPLDDDRAVELAALAANGIHDPATMPFGTPWSRAESPELERRALQFQWRSRAEMSPERWRIAFAVAVAGQVIGTTDLFADDFGRMRQFETGSWLGREFQGQGLGREMRLATLALGFDGFGADWALTGAWHDNGPSLGVTRSLGYTELGTRRMLRDDAAPDQLIGFEMPRRHYDEQLRRDDIELVGVDAVRDFLAIEERGTAQGVVGDAGRG